MFCFVFGIFALAGSTESVCGMAVETAISVSKGRGRNHVWMSFCPTSGDMRDLWKWPFSLVAGIASRISPEILKGAQRARTELQTVWRNAITNSFPLAAKSLAAAGMLRNGTDCPIIAATWPVSFSAHKFGELFVCIRCCCLAC